MGDLVAVGIVVAFFALMVAYVRWCDRIVGPEAAVSEAAPGAAQADVPEVPA